MCFTIPKQIKSIDGAMATLETGEKADITGLDNIKTGDYINITGNIAIEKVERKEAQQTRRTIKEIG